MNMKNKKKNKANALAADADAANSAYYAAIKAWNKRERK